MRSKYSRWDGTQEPFGEPLEVGRVLDEISDDLLSGVGPRQAIRRLMRRGLDSGTSGLDELRRRLAERRKAWTEATNLQGPLNEIKDKLNEILEQEREVLAGRDDPDARSRETFLDTLPDSPAPAMKELMDYRFADPQAQQRFNELVESVQREILGAYFGQMVGAMQSLTPEELARMREMVAELNAMVAARERGEPYDFEGFMEKYGDFFPENPRSLDELLEVLARRMAAMSRLLASLSPEQRRQLQELANTVLGDLDLAFEMEMLGQELRSLMPNLPWDQAALGMGDDPTSLGAAVGAIEELSDMEQLEESLAGSYPGATIEDVDEEKLQRALGDQAVQDLRQLKQIEKALEEAGIVSKDRGKIELTARGIRRIGERALVKVFEVLRQERPGGHENRQAGGAAEPTGATRQWQFGDSGEISVQKTVFNAVMRTAASSAGGLQGRSTSLTADDFELIDAESRTRTATALLLDLSFSMTLRGHWVPAKRMALALQSLIESKYPEDSLYFIGFSDYARRLDPSELTATGPIERVYGTNMQHAFLLARRLLTQHPRSSKQVIMVTDGEPTAHLEHGRRSPRLGSLMEQLAGLGLSVPEIDDGEAMSEGDPDGPHSVFSWPPTSTTIHKTLAEAVRLSASGATLNIFMLEEDQGLIRFMDELAKRTSGRVFQTAGQDIGRFVIRDFVKRR